ncbi:gag-pol polyprotein [Tanacetum coccineum]
MVAKLEIEKFNGNNFSLRKLKMKAILTKDKCLAATGERRAEVTNDSNWDEIDENAVANLHLALADGGGQTSQFKTGGGFGGDEKEINGTPVGVTIMGNVASTSEDGNALCCEAAVANESRKRFANVWLFDTGATFHMIARIEWFHQYKPIFEGGSVYSCNDYELKIIEIGSIMVKMHDEEIMKEAEASIASHSPNHRVVVTWHQKLGHMSKQGMKILVERKLLSGLTKVSLLFCEHSPVLSLGGAKYFVSFIDNYSRRCLVYPIKKKSDVFEVFKVYKARVKLDSRKKIKFLGTDNGVEYTSDEFDTFCRQEGIKRQFTTVYTPQQNGVAERMNITLLERARAMLATASLGKSFWAEAVNTACYVINRSPSTAVELKTSLQMWTGRPINYSDLHIFGSPVYVMYNTQATTKLDPKSGKCLFLGYADGIKGVSLVGPHCPQTAPQHEVNEANESQASAPRTLNHERRHPWWHSDYVMENNVAYCLLTKEGELSTLQEALNNPDASFWKEAMQEEIEALYKNKTWELVPLPAD